MIKVSAESLKVGDVIMPPAREVQLWMARDAVQVQGSARNAVVSCGRRNGATLMKNDTGESTRSIIRRGDDANWPRAKMALEQSGCILHRPSKMDVYVARNGAGQYLSGTSLSKAAIRRLEQSGEIIHAGVDTYILNRARNIS